MKVTEKAIVSMSIFLFLPNASTEMMKSTNSSLISPSHPLKDVATFGEILKDRYYKER